MSLIIRFLVYCEWVDEEIILSPFIALLTIPQFWLPQIVKIWFGSQSSETDLD